MNKDIRLNDYIKIPGVWDYFSSLILMLLPLVGIIVTLFFVFSRRTFSPKRRLAKAMLLVHTCMIMVAVLLVAIGGYFVVSYINDHPQIKNAVTYFGAYAKEGINGVISEMNKTGDLETLVKNIDLSESLKNINFRKALEDVDIRFLIDNLNAEKIINSFDPEQIANNFNTRKLIELVGSDKIAEYIDFEELVEKVDIETLERWLKLISEYLSGENTP